MPHLSGIIGDKTWVHSIREYSKWLPLLFLLNSSLLSGYWSMSIWINKKRKNNIYSTGKHWVNNACVSAPACRERERRVDGADMFTASRTCDRVSLTVPLWLFPLCFVLHLVCPRKAISSSQNKSIASRRVLLSASMTICLSISRLYVLRRMDWDGSHFLLKIWVS